MKTNKDLKRHAGEIYTHANFYKFQNEFWNTCTGYEVEDRQAIDEGFVITIVENTRNMGKKRQIVYNPSDHVALCSCKIFEWEGIPYNHILCVLKGKFLCELPTYYILNRLTKMSASKPIFDVHGTI